MSPPAALNDTGRADGAMPTDHGARRLKTLAIVVWAGSISAVVVTALLWIAARFEPPAVAFYRGPLVAAAEWALVAITATMGLVIARQRPRHRLGWISAALAMVIALQCISVGFEAYAGVHGLSRPGWLRATEWLASSFTLPVAVTLTVLATLLFPDGRIERPRQAALAGGAVAAGVAMAIGLGFSPGPLAWYPSLDNPLGAPAALGAFLTAAWWLGVAAMVAMEVGAAWSFVERYRRAGELEQRQMRWFGYAVGLVVGALALFFLVWAQGDFTSPGAEVAAAVFILAGSLPWVATAIAIQRYHLFDIDTIISRTFVYGLLVAFLAGAYTASIRLFNAVFTTVTGQTSDVALVLTTLVLATTFTPVKAALERSAHRWADGARPTPRLALHPSDNNAGLVDLDDPALRALITDIVEERLGRGRA